MSTLKTNQLAHTANGAATYTLPQTDGSAGQVLQTNGSGVLSWVTPASGITHAQTWRRGSFTGTADPILSYAKYTNNNHGSLGADMTESSGIFTFPVTGFWYINVRGYLYKDSNVASATIGIKSTSDNSSYSLSGNTYYTHVDSDGGTQYNSSSNTLIFDVTDTSQCKVKFVAQGSSAQWDSSHAEFIRLGDT